MSRTRYFSHASGGGLEEKVPAKRGVAALPLEIAAVLAFKAAALLLLYLLFFDPAPLVTARASQAATFILGAAPQRN